MYAWELPVLHVDAAGVMKCDHKGTGAQTGQADGWGVYVRDVIRTNGSSTCIAITAAPAPPPPATDTWTWHPDVASCMKTGSGTNGARTSGTIADCAHIGLCKNDNDFTPEARGTGAAANCKDGLQYLLSKFQEAGSVSYLAWANVTCSDIESKTYQDAGSTETKKMADTLEGWSSFCCGGKDKMKLPCSLSSSSFSFAPDLAVNLVLAASTVSLLQVLSGW
jgi:hypothetical protein